MNSDSWTVYRACVVLAGYGQRHEVVSDATKATLYLRGLMSENELTDRGRRLAEEARGRSFFAVEALQRNAR